MALTITTPIDTISGILTDVIAAKSQALYGLAREDHQVDEVATFVTGLAVWLTGDYTTLYNDGDVVYLSQITRTSDGALVCPAGVGVISGTPSFAGGFTKINVVKDDVVTTYPGVSIDGFINNETVRANYRVEVELFDGADKILDRTISYGLPRTGVESIDIKSTLIDYMKINDLQYVEYVAEFTEAWDSSAESESAQTEVLAVLGSKQILKTGGALMYEYITDTGTPGAYLTRFTNPTMFRGWKRTVSLVIDSDFVARTGDASITVFQWKADINKVKGAALGNDNYAIAVPRVLEQDVTETTDPYTLIQTEGVASTDAVLEDIYFGMQDECLQPIMVEWLNSLGGYEQFMFTIEQEFINEGGDSEGVNSPVIGNISTFKGGKSRVVGPTRQRVRMDSERLTGDEMRALAEIKNSDVVRVFLSKDGTSYVNTRVTGDTNTSFSSRYDVNTFSLELEFPDGFDFFEGKLY